MSTQSTLASVEVRIDWEDTVSRHHNRDHFEKLNFWRDILPGALSITLWTELHPFERLALVQEYFRAAGNFTSLETGTVHGLPRPQDDRYAQQRAFSDPVFAVRAVAAA